MLIFTIIVFGLAVIRTITPLVDAKNINLYTLSLAITMVWCYVWFLQQHVLLK